MPNHVGPSRTSMDRSGYTYPVRICPKCKQPGPIVYETKVCVVCGARDYNKYKKLTLKNSNGQKETNT